MSRRRVDLAYGPHRGQVGELWLPGGTRDAVPVVALLHGGFWHAPYSKRLMHRLAADVTQRGWAAWNVEYRRVGRFGGGGGWPATFADVAAALDHVAVLPGVDPARVAICGHSAGAQLALWCAGPRHLPGGPALAGIVRPRAVVSLAGVLDLVRGAELGLGRGAIPALLGGGPGAVPERYAAASPIDLLPLGVDQVIVHGEEDAVVPPAMSDRYVKAAADAGDPIVLESVPALGHLAMIHPGRAAWRVAAAHLERLLG
ncbi:MAG: alpha/beta hydrolase family protein [Acidimicrobiales bacterium]